MIEPKRNYTGKKKYGSYVYEYTDSNGQKHEGFTSESPEEFKTRWIKYNIELQAKKITIKFDGNEYNTEQLQKIYGDLPGGLYKSQWEKEMEEIKDVYNDENISEEDLNEVKKIKNQQDAKKWKSRIRSLRKKGKLEQYKIDSLNKLGMIWYPKGGSLRSYDEWEDNYLAYKKDGLCVEIKDWVKEQRILFENKNLSNENLFRLKAADFPFKAIENEKYKLTRRSCWTLREKLERKVKRYVTAEEKKHGIYKKEKVLTFKDLPKKEQEQRKEVNSFYNRKSSYCDVHRLNKMNKEEALLILSNIDKGISFQDARLKEFLDIESKKYRKNNKKTPQWILRFYDDVNDEKLDDEKIYLQFSQFNKSTINTYLRKKACHYMLKYLPNINIKSAKLLFKEVNYLISIYKKEKNKTELIYLKDYIEKYPMLDEFYGEKINLTILKLK